MNIPCAPDCYTVINGVQQSVCTQNETRSTKKIKIIKKNYGRASGQWSHVQCLVWRVVCTNATKVKVAGFFTAEGKNVSGNMQEFHRRQNVAEWRVSGFDQLTVR